MDDKHLTFFFLSFNAQAFWDTTGSLWTTGGLHGKPAGLFISTGSLGGGQESTAIASLSTLTHHGMNFVPLGYARAFDKLTNLSEIHGGECLYALLPFFHPAFGLVIGDNWLTLFVCSGSPWGAGTFAGADGSRQPSALELEIAKIQGQTLYELVSKRA
jgi:NAD(P)H dehydrogenase (quinone)